MFNINDRVLVTIPDHINQVDNHYEGTIVDIEECDEYNVEQLRRFRKSIPDNIKRVSTGRYGIKLDNNPLIVELPYFWPREFKLLDKGI